MYVHIHTTTKQNRREHKQQKNKKFVSIYKKLKVDNII